MKIPEEYKWAYEKAELSKDRPTLFTGAAFMQLIERIATLMEHVEETRDNLRQMTECRDDLNRLVAQRDQELAQARAEIERLGAIERAVNIRLNDHLCEMKPECDDSITGFNEAWDVVRAAYKETKLTETYKNAIVERGSLRAQLEQMRRPVTDEEWAKSYWTEDGGMRGFVNSFLAARARQWEIDA